MSVMSWRRSPLADRHRALGSNLEDWNGMETAWTYTASDLADEHEAIRTKAAIMDVSGLRKVHLGRPAFASHPAACHDARRPQGHAGQVRLCLHVERRRQVHGRLHPLPHRPECLDGGDRLGHGLRGTHPRHRGQKCRDPVRRRPAGPLVARAARGRLPRTATCPASAASNISTTCRRPCSAVP